MDPVLKILTELLLPENLGIFNAALPSLSPFSSRLRSNVGSAAKTLFRVRLQYHQRTQARWVKRKHSVGLNF